MTTNNWQESETIEFKQSLAEKEDAGADLCAFANKNGGVLYFGVKNSGEIVGLQDVNEKTIRELAQLYRDNIQPAIYPSLEIEVVDGHSVIKICINKSDAPYHTFRETPYIRNGSASPKMKQDEYQRRLLKYHSTNTDYSAKIVTNADFSDLSSGAISELRKLLNKSKRFGQDIEQLSDIELLQNLQLMHENAVTVAALVLLGSEDGLYKHLPYAEIRYGYRLSTTEERNQDSYIFKGGYLTYFNLLWEKINSRNITLNIPTGLFLTERKAFEEETIREAVNNAVMHRDYQSNETIIIIQYPTLFEITNPGGFVEGVNLENIRTATKARNKLIGDILYKCDFVEQFGTGVNLMFKNQLSLGKNPPDFSKTDDYRVGLILDGAIKDIEFAKYVLKVVDQQQKTLSDEELFLLYKIKNREKVISPKIDSLFELGLIEKIGRGKYILSKKYYFDVNQKGKYTRHKGLDRETNKALILNHLKEFPDGAKKQELQDVLPQLEWVQIWRILNQLRDEGKIAFTGVRRSKSGVYKLI